MMVTSCFFRNSIICLWISGQLVLTSLKHSSSSASALKSICTLGTARKNIVNVKFKLKSTLRTLLEFKGGCKLNSKFTFDVNFEFTVRRYVQWNYCISHFDCTYSGHVCSRGIFDWHGHIFIGRSFLKKLKARTFFRTFFFEYQSFSG